MSRFTRIPRTVRILIIIFSVFLLLLAVLLSIAPTIAVNYINKNAEEWIGRKLHIEKARVNYFTTRLTVEHFTLYEPNGVDSFVYNRSFFVDAKFWPLLRRKIVVEEVELEDPSLWIVQENGEFNFEDLLALAQSGHRASADPPRPIEYDIRNIRIQSAYLSYEIPELNNKLALDAINVSSRQISSSDPIIRAAVRSNFIQGGDADIDFSLNRDSATYTIKSQLNRLSLSFLEPVIVSAFNLVAFDGELDLNMLFTGNYEDIEDLTLRGDLGLHDLYISENKDEKLFSIDKLEAGIDTIAIKEQDIRLHKLNLDGFYALYEMYPNGNNYEKLLQSIGTSREKALAEGVQKKQNIYEMIATYIAQYFAEFTVSTYQIAEFKLANSSLKVRDFTIEDPFEYDIDQLRIVSEAVSSNSDIITFKSSCLLNHSGLFDGSVSVNPQNYWDLDVAYSITKFVVEDFSGHSDHYTAFPIINGDLRYDGKIRIRDGKLESENYISIYDFFIGRKTHAGAPYNLPLRLAVSLLKDRKGVVVLDVPVTGDLKNPKFNLRKTIGNVVKNLVTKAVTAPYDLIAGWFDGNKKMAREFYFDYGRTSLDKRALRSLNRLVKLLEAKEAIHVTFVQLRDKEKEQQLLAVEEVKKAYLQDRGDSLIKRKEPLDEISVFDSAFVAYVDKQLPAPDSLTPPQVKCMQLFPVDVLKEKVEGMMESRNQKVQQFLLEKGIAEDRFSFRRATSEEMQKERDLPKFLMIYGESPNVPQ